MRPGSHRRPVPLPPICQVVPAFCAGPRMIGYLVRGVPELLANILRFQIHITCDLIVKYIAQPARSMPRAERCARFDGQLIKRQVVHGHLQRLGQLAPPRRRILLLPRINQVKAHPRERVPRDVERRPGLGRAVHPPQPPQIRVVERLHPHRQPVHTRVGITAKAPRLDAGGVRLQRDLHVVRQRPSRARRLDHPRHRFRRHQRRRAAAKEDAAQHASGDLGRQPRNLGAKGGQPTRLVDRRRHVAVEIAVRAFRRAERPVDVQRKAARAPVLGRHGRGGVSQGPPAAS